MNIGWPGIVDVVVKIACFRVVADGALAQGAGHEDLLAPGLARLKRHTVIFLPALAAEARRKQQPLAVAGHVGAGVEGDVTLRRRLQGREDGVAAAEELVQAEGKNRRVHFGLFDLITGH